METAKRIRKTLLRDIMCVAASLCAAAVCVVKPMFNNAKSVSVASEGYYNDIPSEDSTTDNIAIYNTCRNAVYSDLCTVGTVYLSNCEKGKYTGTSQLYENMIGKLSWFRFDDGKNPFGIEGGALRGLSIAQSQYRITNIDSDYYWFFVSYGDEFLTNIGKYKTVKPDEIGSVPDMLKEDYSDWFYLRSSNLLNFVTKYNEGGRGKTETYYTVSDKHGGVKLTSEYIDSDRVMFGTCGTDNYGNYIFCFDNNGDKCISTYSSSEKPEGVLHLNTDGSVTLVEGMIGYVDTDGLYREYINDSEVHDGERCEQGTERYYELLNQFGGAAEGTNWVELKNFPNYDFETLDTEKLTVFMAPKTDIPAAIQTYTEAKKQEYDFYNTLLEALTIAWLSFTAASVILTITRRAEYYREDSGRRTAVFKPDFSAVMVFFSMILIAFGIDDRHHYWYTFDTPLSPRIKHFAGWGLFIAAAHFLLVLSVEGIVRWIKVSGLRHPDLMAKHIWKRSEGIRRKAAGISFIRWHRGLSVLTRYALMTAEIIISGLIALNGYDYLPSDEAYLVAGIFMLFAIRFAVVSFRLVCGFSKLEKQADNMLKPESEQVHFRPIGETSPLKPLSRRLEDVSARAEQAVEQQVQSERMKVELVTNVSHDLKTPLTSIISYIDLLEKSELSDEARDYVSIISRKADKLRDIVSDVFTLAKAVSGVEVELDELDMAILTRQVLADNSDKTEVSGRDLRVNIVPENAPIIADGVKLYRVIQNLLDNALKYSMPFTRIFIDLTETSEGFELTVKNVSEREIDFTADEILERFARGDKSRSDGGSGLGLSIAKSFTEACGGRFAIEIDGDLFKASVLFPKNKPEPMSEPVLMLGGE